MAFQKKSEEENEFVGFIGGKMKRHPLTGVLYGNIPMFGVDPKCRGLGIGTMLLKTVLKRFHDFNATYVTL